MKFLKFSLVLLVFASAGFFYSCSKDDSPSTEEVGEVVTPSEINQGQVVSIEMPNAVPAQQYTGTLGGNTIQLVRSGENIVMFRVPVTLLGETDLVVSDLGLDLHYNVNETVLTATPEQELAPLFTDVADFSESISNEQSEEADIVNQYIDSFNAYYNTLTDAEKEQLAIIYKANSELFNGIIAGDLTAGRPMDINFNIDTQLLKHKLAVLALGGGVTFVILAPDPLEKSLGALVAVIAWKKAKGYLNDFMSAKLRKLNVLFQGVTGNLDRGNMENLTFTSGEQKSFSFDVQGRDIQSGDTASATGGLTTFFSSHSIFTGAVTELNNAIEFVNDNLFFSNISLIPVYTMPSSQPTEVQDGDSAFFDAMQLSVAHSNVTMSDVSFSNGAISMKLTIDNPDAVSGESIETTIDYAYQDELNSFGGSFPIIVNVSDSEIDLSGNWIMKVNNPYEFGTLDGDPALYKFVFNTNTISFNQITVISDGYQEGGASLHQDLVTNQYSLEGNNLEIDLLYQLQFDYTCEGEDYQTNLTQNEIITVTYNPELDKFTGTLNETGEYQGISNSCMETDPFDVQRSIQIYRE